MSPQGEVIFSRTYSRTKPDGSKETWPETVERVVDGNLALVPERHQIENERQDLIDMMTEFKLLPAGRHLWASGVKNGQHLFNCFSGDTKVHTDHGVFPIEKLAGNTFNVLSDGAEYRPARFDSYGIQELLEVTLCGGEKIYATPDHSWVTYNSGSFYRHRTVSLAGKRIPYNPAPAPVRNGDYLEGVAHGIVYGDGSQSGAISTRVWLFGEKRGLSQYLIPFSRNEEATEHDDRTYVGRLPAHWKMLPVEPSRSYARGFIAALIATDGYAKNGTAQINQSVSPNAVADLAAFAGLVVSNVAVDRERSPYDGTHAPSYRIGIRGWSIDPDLDLLRPLHRARFGVSRAARLRTVQVQSVRKTGRFEEVFCAVEPETHTITIGSGVLTGQCWISHWTEKPSDHFAFAFLRLMEGGGVGANYTFKHVASYGVVKQDVLVDIVCDPEHPDYEAMQSEGLLSNEYHPDWAGSFEIEDSREGWASALTDLIDTHYRDEVKHFHRVYDVSRVRPAGARLRTFGGRASGPLPLARMLRDVNAVLADLAYRGRMMTGLDAMEIDHAIAQCVVAGGVRRSARMSMMHWADPQIEEFVKCKWETGSHWTTNISVEVDDSFWRWLQEPEVVEIGKNRAHLVLKAIAEGMVANGEPGFWDSSLANQGEPTPVACTNPCMSANTWVHTTEGARQVRELVGRRFVAIVDGKPYNSISDGFFKTGYKQLFRLETDEGWSAEVTADHELYRPDGTRVKASALEPGDKVRLSDHRGVVPWSGAGSLLEGYALGWLIGDGTFGPHAILQSQGKSATDRSRKELESFVRTLGHRSDFTGWTGPYANGQVRLGTKAFSQRAAEWGVTKATKTVTDDIERGSWDLYVGVLRGLFDTDGHVECSRNAGVSVRLSSSDRPMLLRVQRMLGRMGIRASIRSLKDAGSVVCPNTGNAYETKRSYRLLITNRVNVMRFRDVIGFWHADKEGQLAASIDMLCADREPQVKFEATFKSLTYLREEDVYDCTIDRVYDFCGDGLYMRDCGEICLEPWEPCNLGHINLAAFVKPSGKLDQLSLLKAHRLMTRFLIRATFSGVGDPKSRAVLDRNRRIGVGHLGVASALAMLGKKFSEAPSDDWFRDTLRWLASAVDEEAAAFAHELRIPVPVKKRTVAPTGTIAKLAGVSEGIHPIFSRYFIRRIRFNYRSDFEALEKLLAEGYSVEDDLYAPNTGVVAIPTKDSLLEAVEAIWGARRAEGIVQSADELSLEEMLSFQAMYQELWADNAVSFTANISRSLEGEPVFAAVEVGEQIRKFGGLLKGATIFPEASMPQAPYERITKAEYEAAVVKDVSDGVDEECASGACPIR